jgi:hypothetical protein
MLRRSAGRSSGWSIPCARQRGREGCSLRQWQAGVGCENGCARGQQSVDRREGCGRWRNQAYPGRTVAHEAASAGEACC